jgi:raffinose/stachyose/melibiose transport system substrate-binding protein
MMIIAKRYLLVLVAVALLFSCGNRSTSGREKKEKGLIMWDIAQSEPYTTWWEGYVSEWNAANPDMQVSLEVFETDPYKTKLVGALASNTAADIVYQMAGQESFKYFREGKFVSLEGLLDTGKFTKSVMDLCSVEDQVVCMPLYMAPSYIYYNKRLFEKVGVNVSAWKKPMQPSWEEFSAACNKLRDNGVVPIGLGNADQWPGLFWYQSFQNRFGGNEALYAAMEGRTSYSQDSFIKAAEYMHLMDKNGWLPVGYNGIAGEQKYALFTQEQAAMIYQGSWMLGYIKEGTGSDFRYGFFHFPSFPDGNPGSQMDVMSGVDALWITSSCKEPKKAAEFLNGFAETVRANNFTKETSNISVIRSVVAGGMEGILGEMMVETSKASDYMPWWDVELPAPVAEALLNSIQDITAGTITPQELVQLLDKAVGR